MDRIIRMFSICYYIYSRRHNIFRPDKVISRNLYLKTVMMFLLGSIVQCPKILFFPFYKLSDSS